MKRLIAAGDGTDSTLFNGLVNSATQLALFNQQDGVNSEDAARDAVEDLANNLTLTDIAPEATVTLLSRLAVEGEPAARLAAARGLTGVLENNPALRAALPPDLKAHADTLEQLVTAGMTAQDAARAAEILFNKWDGSLDRYGGSQFENRPIHQTTGISI